MALPIIIIAIVVALIVLRGVMADPKVDIIYTYFCSKKVWINARYKAKFDNASLHITINRPDILQKIVRVDSYNKRRMTFNPLLWSYHAYGQAIDINPSEFPYSTTQYPLPQWYKDLALIMKSYGFRWGGDWWSVFDPMHFEIGKRENKPDV